MKFLQCLFGLAVVLSLGGTANATVVQINFGGASGLSDWNEMSSATADILYAAGTPGSGLLDDAGDSTGWSLTTDDTNRFNSINTNGTTSPSGAAAQIFPSTVAAQSFYGNTISFNNGTYPLAKLYFDGLSATATYDFVLFASRTGVTDNRETLYAAVGANTKSDTLNAANNTSEVAELVGIVPDAEGRIELQVTVGANNNNSYGFYYLNGMTITESVPEPATLALLILGSATTGLVWLARKRVARK